MTKSLRLLGTLWLRIFLTLDLHDLCGVRWDVVNAVLRPPTKSIRRVDTMRWFVVRVSLLGLGVQFDVRLPGERFTVR